MSLELCILASGSSGNCAAVRAGSGVMLIDAGIGPRTAGKRLGGTGVALGDVLAICLTHLDRDHFNANWVSTIVRQQIRVFCHAGRRDDLLRNVAWHQDAAEFADCIDAFDAGHFSPIEGVELQPIALAHDECGSHGFVIDGGSCRIGYATDLGRVPAELIELFCDLDVLAIESNYDPLMQTASARPWFLKQRIMGGAGHLSNEQALSAVRRVLDRCRDLGQRLPAHIVLLHRSAQCNCPQLLRRLFGQDPRISQRLTLADQYQRTEWLRPMDVPPALGEQLALAFA
ncbi:MAG TPA: MBL fold metallo-hydrolase [Tepidisphaeraceae bacterium]